MKFYRLQIQQAICDGSGHDLHKYGRDFEIVQVVLAKLPPLALVHAILNRRGYVGKYTSRCACVRAAFAEFVAASLDFG